METKYAIALQSNSKHAKQKENMKNRCDISSKRLDVPKRKLHKPEERKKTPCDTLNIELGTE